MIKASSIQALWILHCTHVFTARLLSTHIFNAFFGNWLFRFISWLRSYLPCATFPPIGNTLES